MTSAPPPKITWGPRCGCGNPDIPHRHGVSETGTHLAIQRPWGPSSRKLA